MKGIPVVSMEKCFILAPLHAMHLKNRKAVSRSRNYSLQSKNNTVLITCACFVVPTRLAIADAEGASG